MSCWTANRRGVKLVSEVIKRRHPNAHVAVGGPHATPLGTELLRNYTNVDTVCLGESDVTFLEIVDRQKGRLSPWGCSSSPMARACLSAIFRGPRLGLAGRRWGSYALEVKLAPANENSKLQVIFGEVTLDVGDAPSKEQGTSRNSKKSGKDKEREDAAAKEADGKSVPPPGG